MLIAKLVVLRLQSLGEDLMKGCLSYEIVRLMGKGARHNKHVIKPSMLFMKKTQRYGKAGAFSLVAMNKQGDWGVATNVEFTFTVGTDMQQPEIYIAKSRQESYYRDSADFTRMLAAYEKEIKALIE